MAILNLTDVQKRTVRRARFDAIRAIQFVIEDLRQHPLPEAVTAFYGISTARQGELLANNFERILKFLQKIHTENFRYDNSGGRTFAYVDLNQPERIFLMELFFNAPAYGEDSQMGIIIHEASHLVLRTEDYAYGRTACLRLARQENQGLARNNADNFEAIVEEDY